MKRYVEYLPISVSVLSILFAIYIVFYSSDQNQKTNEKINSQSEEITNLNQKVNDLESALLNTQDQNISFAEALKEAQENSGSISDKINRISESVGTLEKITQTDPELLQKYSKVFFLNENYTPTNLRKIPEEYVYDKNRTYQIHQEIWPYLQDMIDSAKNDGHELRIISSYRSFGDQAILKNGYVVTYGAGTANQFSADQGYSEHQLGTTIDFTNTTLGSRFSEFGDSKSYKWLVDNAHRFGFILSYPEGNSYYQYEPWHWRFVGVKLAKDLKKDGRDFYDLSQREIDDYLVNFFD